MKKLLTVFFVCIIAISHLHIADIFIHNKNSTSTQSFSKNTKEIGDEKTSSEEDYSLMDIKLFTNLHSFNDPFHYVMIMSKTIHKQVDANIHSNPFHEEDIKPPNNPLFHQNLI